MYICMYLIQPQSDGWHETFLIIDVYISTVCLISDLYLYHRVTRLDEFFTHYR
jgi:hypothetical protein